MILSTAATSAALIAAGTYAVAVLERWSVTGRLQPSAPFLAVAAAFAPRSSVPRKADRILFEIAPLLLLLAGVLAACVLPVSPGLPGIGLATGALFVNAAFAYVLVSLFAGGWATNSAYALVGAFRFLGQLIAYSMLIVMPITAVAMRARSLANEDIVRSQAALPNCVAQPLGFLSFVLASMALSFLPPFDLPVARGELAEGVWGEYTGFRLALFRAGRLVVVLAASAATAVFFLGGWLGPVLPGWTWTALKTLAVAAAMLAAGRAVPRLRGDDVLAVAWKLGIPLALANILWVGITLLLVQR